ncbi:MAG: zinc ribbon domain-containing protein [Fuerstiella sp.]
MCETEQTYDLFKVKTYFTLYFIPLFPVGSGDEHIQCENCSGTFAPELIDYDPEAEQAATAQTLRRICALFLYDIGRISTTTLEAIQKIVSESIGIQVNKEDLAQDTSHAQEADADFLKYCKSELAEYSEEGKLLVIVSLRRVLESEGDLDNLEHDRLLELGKHLKLKKRDVKEILTMDLNEQDEEF